MKRNLLSLKGEDLSKYGDIKVDGKYTEEFLQRLSKYFEGTGELRRKELIIANRYLTQDICKHRDLFMLDIRLGAMR